MPNALARSPGSVNVVASRDRAAGASMRGEHALEGAGADEQPEALRGAAERGCTGEADQARDERPFAAEQVGDPAAEQQQAAERERVGGDDPLALVVGEPELLLGGGERDVDDRHVEHDQQLGDADDDEDHPAAVVMGVCGEGHGEDLTDVERVSPVKLSQVETTSPLSRMRPS